MWLVLGTQVWFFNAVIDSRVDLPFRLLSTLPLVCLVAGLVLAKRHPHRMLKNLPSRKLPTQHRRTVCRGSMKLKASIRNVDADDANVVHGRTPYALNAHRVCFLLGAS